jgi:hypothetical protein
MDGARTGGGRDHRRAPSVDGVDDLRVVDALQIDRGDPEMGMPELALDDDQRDALVGQLDRVREAQLVGREPALRSGAITPPGVPGRSHL